MPDDEHVDLSWLEEEGSLILLRDDAGGSVVRLGDTVWDRTHVEIAKRTPGTVPVAWFGEPRFVWE